MKIVIDIDDIAYKFVQNTSFVEDESTMFEQTSADRKKTLFLFGILDAIKNGTPLPEGAEILTKEAYSDLCTRASDVPDFESEEYINERLNNYNKLLKSGILDCIIEKSQESENKSCDKCKWNKTEKCQPSTCAMIGCDGHGLWEMIESEDKE